MDWKEKLILEFMVKDSGIGMDPEVLEIIFDPFEQESPEINRAYGGTGLGLSFVNHL